MSKPINKKPRVHYLVPYLANPVHPIFVDVVGAGGTGSQVITFLARLNLALKAFGLPGLMVTVWDGDKIGVENLGRQLFFESEIGVHKATAIVQRVNRLYGFGWHAVPRNYARTKEKWRCNVIISCVDKFESRKIVHDIFYTPTSASFEFDSYYWIDTGNGRDYGQVFLASKQIKQPKTTKFETVPKLPSMFDLYPEDKLKEDDKNSGPSCSLAEALYQQDLFINPAVALFAVDLFKKMLVNMVIGIRGAYINLATNTVNPINL